MKHRVAREFAERWQKIGGTIDALRQHRNLIDQQ